MLLLVPLSLSIAAAQYVPQPFTYQEAEDSQLLHAYELHDPAAVRHALENGPKVSSPYLTTLLFSVLQQEKWNTTDEGREKACAIMALLLDHGADINHRGEFGETVLQGSLEGSLLSGLIIFEVLLAHKPDLNVQDSNGSGIVTLALKRGPESDPYLYARELAKSGAPVDIPNKQGCTPIMFVIQTYAFADPTPLDFVKLLLAKGADPERRDKQGQSAIDRAIAFGDYDALILLDSKGAHRDVYEATKRKVKERELSLAVEDALFGGDKRAEAMATVTKLLKAGVDPNAPSVFQCNTILGETIDRSENVDRARQHEVMTYLLDHGADPNKAFPDGTIPLEAALRVHRPDIFALLQARGAKLNRSLQLAQAASTAVIEDIEEATFRHQFAKNASGQQSATGAYFLSIQDKLGKAVDPSTEFLQRFAGNKPRVAPVSQCKASPEKGVQDTKTGEQGLIFSIESLRWKSETEVEVDGGYYEAGLSASGNTYTLQKKNGKWVVVKDVMHWIS
jgi:ankyrin repeat protein